MPPALSQRGAFPIPHAYVVPCAAATALDTERVSECVEPVVTGQATRFSPAEA